MMGFSDWLVEYELSDDDLSPSHVHEDDIDHDEFNKHDFGDVSGHSITHYKSKIRGDSHYTFVKNSKGETVGSMEHKKPTRGRRLALSNITKIKGSSFSMVDVLHHMVKKGHTLESDNTNTISGAHPMLQKLAHRSDIKAHIEDGKGNVIPHKGNISSIENTKKYAVHSSDENFLNDSTHKHTLVFNKNDD